MVPNWASIEDWPFLFLFYLYFSIICHIIIIIIIFDRIMWDVNFVIPDPVGGPFIHKPQRAMIGSDQKAVVTFEDMWLMMNIQRLDVQLVTMFAL